MRQAIVTKYIGPTDHHGARVKAVADAGSVTIPWDHVLDAEDNHEFAALSLAVKFEWVQTGETEEFRSKYKGGGMPSKSEWAYCFVDISEGWTKEVK